MLFFDGPINTLQAHTFEQVYVQGMCMDDFTKDYALEGNRTSDLLNIGKLFIGDNTNLPIIVSSSSKINSSVRPSYPLYFRTATATGTGLKRDSIAY